METESVKIEKATLKETREYCKKNGVIITWFVSRAIENYLLQKGKISESK